MRIDNGIVKWTFIMTGDPVTMTLRGGLTWTVKPSQ
jgi:hypothetical protein